MTLHWKLSTWDLTIEKEQLLKGEKLDERTKAVELEFYGTGTKIKNLHEVLSSAINKVKQVENNKISRFSLIVHDKHTALTDFNQPWMKSTANLHYRILYSMKHLSNLRLFLYDATSFDRAVIWASLTHLEKDLQSIHIRLGKELVPVLKQKELKTNEFAYWGSLYDADFYLLALNLDLIKTRRLNLWSLKQNLASFKKPGFKYLLCQTHLSRSAHRCKFGEVNLAKKFPFYESIM